MTDPVLGNFENKRRVVISLENDSRGDKLWTPDVVKILRWFADLLEKEGAFELCDRREYFSDGTSMMVLCQSHISLESKRETIQIGVETHERQE